ncbi:MAG TPA: S8 family serine peptidase [Solirubrobacterales bacterium]|nr:S8 family serine peptidase [Solirubrobacterales bacterium]
MTDRRPATTALRAFLIALMGLAMLLAAAGPSTARPEERPGVALASARYAPGEVVVKLRGEAGRAVALPPGVGVGEAVRRLRGKPGVAYAAPNYIATASIWPDDPGTPPGRRGHAGDWVLKQWNFLPCGRDCGAAVAAAEPHAAGGIDAIGAWRNLRRSGRPGARGVTVAVLDTGIAYRNTGRRFRRSPDFDRRQFVRGRDVVKNDPLPLDENGHGTHVAGTIAERTGNGIAMTGLAYGAKLMPVRVLNRLGNGQSDDIARGIRFAARHGADVINMSFNFSCTASVPLVLDAIRFAHRRGAVIVASVGNWSGLGDNPRECVQMPAAAPHVIGVGGTTESACLGAYSRRGADVDIVAPGGGPGDGGCTDSRPIFQLTFSGAGFKRFGLPADYEGTSMSAAHVSGAAALVLASGVLGRRPSADQVGRRLLATARDLGAPGRDDSFGRGLLDAGAATSPAGS